MRHPRSLVSRGASLAAAGALTLTSAVLASPPVEAADRTVEDAEASIIDRHIVVLDEDRLSPVERELELRACIEFVEQRGGQVRHEYRAALTGFAATLPDDVLEALATHPSIAYIEQDQLVQAAGELVADGLVGSWRPPWYLDRIDQHYLPLDEVYCPRGTGEGTTIWVIDTGVYAFAGHDDFGGRARQVVDFTGEGNYDGHGHGTWVASVAASRTYGVAKQAQVRGVKVLNVLGSGPTSAVIAGIEYVINNADSRSVACLALSGGYSVSLNNAVCNLANSGVCVVVAAGNDNTDACNLSPASARCEGVLTVGGTDSSDGRTTFSNWGPCIGIWAPGSNITGWFPHRLDPVVYSSSSGAAAIVAGAAAVYGGDCTAVLANATGIWIGDHLFVYVGPCPL